MYPTASDRKLDLIQQITELQNDALVVKFLKMLRDEEKKIAASHVVTDPDKQAKYVQSMQQAEQDFEAGRVHTHEQVKERLRKKMASY